MKDTVTLKELIAIAVRRGQLAVILALAAKITVQKKSRRVIKKLWRLIGKLKPV